ncbi:unnamed protein product [Rhodiola kirilowii]
MESSNKAWSWRKKSAEKAGDVLDQRSNSALNESGHEVNTLLKDKTALEKELQHLNDKLSSAHIEIRARDDLVKRHARFAQEAIAGWEKAESEALSIKEALDVALQQYKISEERCDHLDDALGECMQQLRFVQEQQEQRIHDVLLKATAEFEGTEMVLEEKLSETSKRMSRLEVENRRLNEALMIKDKMIQEIRELMNQVEADCNLLKKRLETTEKDNYSLKYEVRVLEKELEIRNEEREFNCRAADASHKKQLDYVKKLTKLESECQRLRVLVRKRLPDAVAMAKMKDEVVMLEKDSAENRQRRMVELLVDDSPNTPIRRINSLTKELYNLEEENSNLKKTINYKVNELQMSRVMYVRAASRLSQVENLLAVSSKVKVAEDVARNVLPSQEQAMSVLSDIGSDDKFSYAESLVSALNSEQGQQGGNGTNIVSIRPSGISDMNLMDDFLEMEKLAVIYADNLVHESHISPDVVNASSGPIDTESNGHLTELSGPENVHMFDTRSPSIVLNESVNTSDDATLADIPFWLRGILKLIFEQQRLTQRSHVELLGEIQMVMQNMFTTKPSEPVAKIRCPNQYDSPKFLHGSSSNPWPDVLSTRGSNVTVTNAETSMVAKSSQQFQLNLLSDAICKMIELLEGMNLKSPGDDAAESFNGSFSTDKSSEIDTGYMVRVFQWKTSELSHIVFNLVQSCNDLLSGKADIEKYVVALTSAFDWIMNHCFSIQDVSSMRDEIKKHLGWDDTRSECETEVGSSHLIEVNKIRFSRDQASPNFNAFNGRNVLFEDSPREGSQILKGGFSNAESANKDLESKLQDAIDQCENLQHELLMSEKSVISLQKQLETLKESKRMAEDQTEKHMFANEELHSQLTEARVDLNETCQKIISLEVELENKSAYCEDLEATCVELQLQLQSMAKRELPADAMNVERQLQRVTSDWEFAAASEKLAECQETILNLGRQLKTIASPRGASLLDKAIVSTPPVPTTTSINATAPAAPTTPMKKTLNRQRTSLLEKMLAEDNAHANAFGSPKTKEMTITSSFENSIHPVPQTSIIQGSITTFEPLKKCDKETIRTNDEAAVKSLVVMQNKKRGGWSLWRRLFRRKRGISRKMSLSNATN